MALRVLRSPRFQNAELRSTSSRMTSAAPRPPNPKTMAQYSIRKGKRSMSTRPREALRASVRTSLRFMVTAYDVTVRRFRAVAFSASGVILTSERQLLPSKQGSAAGTRHRDQPRDGAVLVEPVRADVRGDDGVLAPARSSSSERGGHHVPSGDRWSRY